MKIRIQNKEDAGKKIPEFKKQMVSVASEIPQLGGAILINCVHEALRGLQVKARHKRTLEYMLQQILTKEGFGESSLLEITAAIRSFLEQWTLALEAAIMYIHKYGKSFQQKINPIFVGTVWGFGRTYAIPENFYHEERDVLYRKIHLFLNQYPMTYAFVFQDVKESDNEKTVKSLLRFRELYQVLNILYTALRTGFQYSIDFSDDEISYSLESSREDILREHWADPSISPRRLFYSLGPDEWNLGVLDERIERQKPLGQIQDDLNEFYQRIHVFYKPYVELQGFSEAFQRYFNFSLDGFYRLIKAMIRLTFENKTKVECVQIRRLEVVLSKMAKLPRNQIRPLLKKLVYNGEDSPPNFPLVSVGPWVTLCHYRTYSSLFHHLRECYNTHYESALKGQPFENKCRQLIEKHGLLTVPNSIILKEEYLPEEVSLSLFRKVKRRTDLDILAKSGPLILLFEAKGRKLTGKQIRKKISLSNILQNTRVDLWWRAYWLSKNWSYFCREYLPNDFKNQFKKATAIIPVIVTTYAIEKISCAPPIITYNEIPPLLETFSKIKPYELIPPLESSLLLAGSIVDIQFFRLIKKES